MRFIKELCAWGLITWGNDINYLALCNKGTKFACSSSSYQKEPYDITSSYWPSGEATLKKTNNFNNLWVFIMPSTSTSPWERKDVPGIILGKSSTSKVDSNDDINNFLILADISRLWLVSPRKGLFKFGKMKTLWRH